MRPSHRVLSVFNVRADEAPVVGLVLGFALLLYAGSVLIRTAGYAIFLNRYGGESLPYVYIGSSAVGAAASYLYLRLYERLPLVAVLRRTLVGLVILTVLARVVLELAGQPNWLVFALPIYAGLLAIVTATLFSSLLGRLFTLQQGKRLFGLLGTGEQLATLFAGLLAPALIRLMGTANLLLVGALCFLGAFLALIPLMRRQGRLLADTDEAESDQAERKNPLSLRGRYLQLIIGLFFLYILSYYIVDNIFYTQVETRFLSEDQVASFLGVFSGVLGGLSLALQVFASGRLLARFGIRPILLITPMLVALFMVPYALLGGFAGASTLFWLAVGANMSLLVMDAIDSPAISLLFQTFPAAARMRVQTLVYGVVDPVAAGLAGVLLLFLFKVLGAGTTQAAYILAVLLSAWLVLAYLLGREYPQQVQNALRQRLFGQSAPVEPDRYSLDLVRHTLDHGQPGAVLYALDLLEQMDPEEIFLAGARLLDHPSEEVRLGALRAIERQNLRALIPAMMSRQARDPSVAVRGSLARVIASVGGVDMLEDVSPMLDSTEAEVRVGALSGLIRAGDMECMVLAFERLQVWTGDVDPQTRVLAVRAIDAAELPALYRTVARLMNDPDPAVRMACLAAAGRLRHPGLWRPVAQRLGEPAERRAAMNALVAGGPQALPALRESLASLSHAAVPDRAQLVYVTRTLGRIGTPDAFSMLLQLVDHPDFAVHNQALHSLRRAGHRQDAAQVQRWIQAEVARAAALAQAARDIPLPTLSGSPTAPAQLVHNALAECQAHIRHNVFCLLSFVDDPALIKRVEDTLSSAGEDRLSREGRDFALEMVDVRIHPALRSWIRPLLDQPLSVDALNTLSPQAAMSAGERLEWLVTGQEWLPPWPRACALYMLCATGHPETRRCAQEAFAAADPLVSETGCWALECLPADSSAGHDRQSGQVQGTGDRPAQRPGHTGGKYGMLTSVERVIALKGVELFKGTPDEVLAELVGMLNEYDLPAGGEVFERGDAGSSMFIVASGTFRVHYGGAEIRLLGEGEVFGEMALLDPAPRSANVSAVTDAVLLELKRDAFFELLEDHVDVTRRILQLLARRLRDTTDRVAQAVQAD